MDAKVLLVAVKLRLFDELRNGPLTPEARSASGSGCMRAPSPTFRTPWSPSASSSGTATALARTESYVGGLLDLYNERTFRYWGELEEALRTGTPQNETKQSGRPVFEELYRDPARLEQFLAAMSGISRPNFLALAEGFDFGPYRTLCDVGGAAADLSCAVAARHPHLLCTSFDLPVVEPVARAAIAHRGLADRVTTAAGDFFRDPPPRADVITMGMILHDWNLEKKDGVDPRGVRGPAGGWRVHRRRESDR
jgi:O-methyltransferase domain